MELKGVDVTNAFLSTSEQSAFYQKKARLQYDAIPSFRLQSRVPIRSNYLWSLIILISDRRLA